jgi:hypothetical protein
MGGLDNEVYYYILIFEDNCTTKEVNLNRK